MKKKHLLFTGLFFVPLLTHAQAEDSVKIISLKEIKLNSAHKNTQQQLLHYYCANKAATLEDIIARLPELSMQRRGPYGMEPSIRSFNGGQINVLVDGMRIHGACTDKMDPASIYIEPANLDHIQVQTASSGFMSGSATGGTVNVKMAEPEFLTDQKISGRISSGYQSAAKSLYESARLNFSAGKWALLATGTYRNNRAYRSGDGEIIRFSQYKKLNYSLSGKYRYSKHTEIKIDLLADDGWNIGYPALPMDVGYAAAKIASMGIRHEDDSKKIYKWQAKLYTNHIRHFMDDTHRPNTTIHMDMPGVSKTSGFSAEATWRLNKKQQFLLKSDAASTFLKASMTMYQPGQQPMYMLTWPDNRKLQAGAGVLWNYEIDSLWRLQVAARADLIDYRLVSVSAKDHVSIFGDIAAKTKLLKNFSILASRKINRKLAINAGISFTERIATTSELYGFYLFNSSDGYDYIGNTSLGSENSLQADAGLTYSGKKYRMQASAYYARTNNYIAGFINPAFSTMTIGAKGVKTYMNIPYAIVLGAEASALLRPGKFILVNTFRYTRSTDNTGKAIPLIAPLKNISSVRFQPGRLFVQLESEAAKKQNRYNAAAGEDATAGFILMHTRAGYHFNTHKAGIEIQAGIENILDKKYHEHTDWGNIPRPGRNFYIQAGIGF
ncbi:MAG: TonB-dependent receptor [Ferruginibacter sp.]